MTIRTLWAIILKIFGLFVLVEFSYPLSQMFTFTLMLSEQSDPVPPWQIFVTIFVPCFYLFIVFTFIFRTDWLIKKLRLEKGFDEEKIELNVRSSAVLKIVVVLFGLYLLVDSLPPFFKDVFAYFQNVNLYNGFKQYAKGGWVIFHLTRALIGLLLVSYNGFIVKFIDNKTRDLEQA